MFYLAQTLKDTGQHEEAIKMYKKRVDAGGWFEEVFYSMYQISRMYYSLKNYTEMEYWGMKAYESNKERAESIYFLTRVFREISQHYKAWHYMKIGKTIRQPSQVLFVESEVYDHLFDYEKTILNCYVQPDKKEDSLRDIIAYYNRKGGSHTLGNVQWYVSKINTLKEQLDNVPTDTDINIDANTELTDNSTIVSWAPYIVKNTQDNSQTVTQDTPRYFSNTTSSSNAVEYKNSLWTMVGISINDQKRYHQLIKINKDSCKVEAYSLPFYFIRNGNEMCTEIKITNDVLTASIVLQNKSTCMVDIDMKEFSMIVFDKDGVTLDRYKDMCKFTYGPVKQNPTVFFYCKEDIYCVFVDYVNSLKSYATVKEHLYTDSSIDNISSNICSNPTDIHIFIQTVVDKCVYTDKVFKNVYLFNTEQMTRPLISRTVNDTVDKLGIRVIDYSIENIRFFTHPEQVTYIPYQVNNAEIKNYDKTEGVAMCGSISQYRTDVFKLIEQSNVPIKQVVGYADYRDNQLFRFKILANVHYNREYTIFETIRCFRCLMNGVIIVSEEGQNSELLEYKDHIIFCKYEDVASKVIDVYNNYDAYYDKLIKTLDIDTLTETLSSKLLSFTNN